MFAPAFKQLAVSEQDALSANRAWEAVSGTFDAKLAVSEYEAESDSSANDDVSEYEAENDAEANDAENDANAYEAMSAYEADIA